MRTSSRSPDVAAVVVIAAVAAAVVVATRGDPRLSPDSITYLSVAEHLRHGADFVDFTRGPFSVFPPVYPLLLAPFGASLEWARVVSALAMATACVALFALLRSRVRPWVAVVAVLAFGATVGSMRVASYVWSETVFSAVTLVSVLALRRAARSWQWAAVAGAAAGLCFLTRYAGVASLAVAPLVVAASWWRRPIDITRRIVPVVAAAAAAWLLAGAWLVRNLVVADQLLGPRLDGGSSESWRVLLWRPFESIGTDLVDRGRWPDRVVGCAAVVAMVAGAVVMWRQRRRTLQRSRGHELVAGDLGVVLLSVLALVVPVVARVLTASDVSARVMSPVLPLLAYVVAVAVDHVLDLAARPGAAPVRRAAGRAVAVGACLAVVASCRAALDVVRQVPDEGSSGERAYYSPELYDAVDALPADTTVITNNPWGVWWINRREPTLFGFVEPRAGNSHVPLDAHRLRDLVCAGPVALAWFTTMANADGESPAERRPDLLGVAALDRIRVVSGGEVYRVRPLDPTTCAVSG